MSESSSIDEQLKALIIRDLPRDNSYGVVAAICRDGCHNDIVKMIMARATIHIDHVIAKQREKRDIKVPFYVSPFTAAKLLKSHAYASSIVSSKLDYIPDVDFQLHKHATLQLLLQTRCISETLVDDETESTSTAYYDGFEPIEYGIFYPTRPRLIPLKLTNVSDLNVDCCDIYINLFDSDYTISQLYTMYDHVIDRGFELIIVMPYDPRMWVTTAANVFDGSYSFQWVPNDNYAPNYSFVSGEKLPQRFFTDPYSNHSLHIRPFHSNKVLVIKRIEFVTLFAHGADEVSFPEVRRIANGFAEVSIIKFYAINESTLNTERSVRKLNVPYHKRVLSGVTGTLKTELNMNFAKAIVPAWNYVIDDKLYDRTKKAALQTRLTRNLIMPLIYHLFAHSTHIVFNGAIVTLQKVMSPELLCQLTENVLNNILPIKIKILQTGNIIRANQSLSNTESALAIMRSLLLMASSSDINVSELFDSIRTCINNPRKLREFLNTLNETAETSINNANLSQTAIVN